MESAGFFEFQREFLRGTEAGVAADHVDMLGAEEGGDNGLVLGQLAGGQGAGFGAGAVSG